MAASIPSAASAQGAQGLDLLGQSDLGGGGLNGEVATIGNTAAVAAGILSGGGLRSGFYNGTYTCPAATVKLVDVSTPSAPSVVGTIPVPANIVANDVSALSVSTPSFSGDLLAVALVRCNFDGNFIDRGVAYYDITNPANPSFLGRYDADQNQEEPDDPPCGPRPEADGFRCASSQDQVTLVQRPDGTVLSLSSEPFASASQRSPVPDPMEIHGDLRVVDVTNPTAPTEVGSYPNRLPVDERPPGFGMEPVGFSNNGCRAFDGGIGVGAYPDGSKALLPFFDQGLLTVDLANPADPGTLGQYQYPRNERTFEGNANYVDLTTSEGRSLALLGEGDWIAPDSTLRIDGPSSVAGSKFACEAIFTLFDPEDTAQVYRKPGGQVPGDFVYVAQACPGVPYPDGMTAADIAGKIAFRDRGRVASRQGSGAFCSVATATKRLQDDGAAGVVVGGTSTVVPQTPSFDGDPTGLTIPTFSIDTDDATGLRDALCPVPDQPPAAGEVACGPGGETISGAMVDSPGAWGALRVVDVTDAANPTLRGVYNPPAAAVFPPPDLGVYAVHHAVGRGSTAYVAGYANGLRVLDLKNADPTEIGSFVPPDTPDPTGQIPAKAHVTGVDVAANGSIVVSDTNSGLYVLRVQPPAPPPPPPPPPTPKFAGCPARAAQTVIALSAASETRNGTLGPDVIFAGAGNDVIDGLAGDDCIDLGTGDDIGRGSGGADLVIGGTGADRIVGSSGNDRLRGNGGADRLGGGNGNDSLRGGSGNDRLVGNRGRDRIFGSTGRDRIFGGFGSDRLHGQSGNDRILGSRGRDRINGGGGSDRIRGDSSRDRVNGDSGSDRINGGSGNDVLRGNSGNDRIVGSTGRDFLSGGSGRDRLLARDRKRDRVRCGTGFDRVVADRGDRVSRDCERVRRR